MCICMNSLTCVQKDRTTTERVHGERERVIGSERRSKHAPAAPLLCVHNTRMTTLGVKGTGDLKEEGRGGIALLVEGRDSSVGRGAG